MSGLTRNRLAVVLAAVTAITLCVVIVCLTVLPNAKQTLPQDVLIIDAGQEAPSIEQGEFGTITSQVALAAAKNEHTSTDTTRGQSGQIMGYTSYEQKSGYWELTAIAEENPTGNTWVFGYWTNSAGLKVSGDATIHVATYNSSTPNYIPIFFQYRTTAGITNDGTYTHVHYISSFADIDSAHATTNWLNRLYILKNDITFTTGFSPWTKTMQTVSKASLTVTIIIFMDLTFRATATVPLWAELFATSMAALSKT